MEEVDHQPWAGLNYRLLPLSQKLRAPVQSWTPGSSCIWDCLIQGCWVVVGSQSFQGLLAYREITLGNTYQTLMVSFDKGLPV